MCDAVFFGKFCNFLRCELRSFVVDNCVGRPLCAKLVRNASMVCKDIVGLIGITSGH